VTAAVRGACRRVPCGGLARMAELIVTGAVDDCWNRIGVYGDKSCPKLPGFVHCHNCDTYAAAATALLDRYQLRDDADTIEIGARHEDGAAVQTRSLLIFRLGDEWLALPTRVLTQVAPVQAIHSLPHRRSTALLGVSNVRGTLVACLSLFKLLDLDEVALPSGSRTFPRMLILATPDDGNVVCPVDEVDGIQAIPEPLLGPVASGKFSLALFQWQSRSVRLLDEKQLMQALVRSLA
jgi:chemotaxis-related protein WspD